MQTSSPTLANAYEQLKAVTSKRRGVALGLWGDAGIGKSYQGQLLLQTLTCRSSSLHATVALPDLAYSLPKPKKLPLWADHALARLARGEVEPARAVAALAAVLAGLAPFVLHLEDVHEADSERLAFIQALARVVVRIKGAGLLVTSRREVPKPFVAVQLLPLSEAEARDLLERKLGTPPPPETASWIYAKAAGNPLYTLEYLRYLTKQGFLWNDGQHWHWRSPPPNTLPLSVEALIERLVDQARAASEVTRYVLEARALLPEATPTVWAKVARVNREDLNSALRTLSSHGIVTEEGFTHPLFKEVTLHTLPPARRCHLARRAVGALQDEPAQAAVFVKDADLPAPQALELLMRAVTQVEERSGVQAAGLLAQAAAYATGEAQGRLALRAARLLRSTDYPAATRLAETAAATCADPSEALLLLAELLALQGRLAEAETALERLDATSAREVHLHRLHVRALAGDHRGVLELWRELEPEAVLPLDLAADVALALNVYGDFETASGLASRALANAHAGDPRRWRLDGVLAELSYYRGQVEEAVTLWSEQVAVLRQTGEQAALADCLKKRAEAWQSLGRLSQKRADLEEACRLYSGLGDGQNFAATRVLLGVLLVEEGRFALAEEVLCESREVLARAGSGVPLLECERMLCYLYRQQALPHSPVLALKHGRAALSLARHLDSPQLVVNALYEVAYAETLAGFPQRGLALAEEGLSLSDRLGYPQTNIYCRFDRAFALEKLGRKVEALADYRACVTAAQTCGLEMDAHTIGVEVDRLTGDAASARARLAWFEAHGHQRRADAVRQAFPELAPGVAAPVPDDLPRLELLGSMQVVRGGEARAVRGAKRKELLARLLEARLAGRSQVSAPQLCDALYPGVFEPEAQKCLKQLVFQVRAGLGQDLVTTTPNGYALGRVDSDAETFLESGDTFLWRGLYLENVSVCDDAVSDALYTSLRAHAAEHLTPNPAVNPTANPTEAARVGRLLLSADPYDLNALGVTLRALHQLGDSKNLERFYRQGRAQLAEVGERLPEAWQLFLEAPENSL